MKCQSKKIVSIFLSLCIIVSLLSVTGINANAVTTDKAVAGRSGEFWYYLENDGNARIYYYKGTNPNLVIPSTINGYTVKYIGEDGDYQSNYTSNVTPSDLQLTSLTIPDTVISIGTGAFLDCKELTTVKLSKNLKVIGYEAFRNCKNLTSINLPETLEVIGDYAFKYCGLTTINIPDSVKTIRNQAFGDCNLDFAILNKNVEYWGSSVFLALILFMYLKGLIVLLLIL